MVNLILTSIRRINHGEHSEWFCFIIFIVFLVFDIFQNVLNIFVTYFSEVSRTLSTTMRWIKNGFTNFRFTALTTFHQSVNDQCLFKRRKKSKTAFLSVAIFSKLPSPIFFSIFPYKTWKRHNWDSSVSYFFVSSLCFNNGRPAGMSV